MSITAHHDAWQANLSALIDAQAAQANALHAAIGAEQAVMACRGPVPPAIREPWPWCPCGEHADLFAKAKAALASSVEAATDAGVRFKEAEGVPELSPTAKVERTVETFATHPPVVHYRCAIPADIHGERLRAELAEAGLPTYDDNLDPDGLGTCTHVSVSGDLLDIAVPYDVDEDRSKLIARVIKAHKGQEHPDEIALRAFTDAMDKFARRILDGEQVDPADVAFFIAAKHR